MTAVEERRERLGGLIRIGGRIQYSDSLQRTPAELRKLAFRCQMRVLGRQRHRHEHFALMTAGHGGIAQANGSSEQVSSA